MGPKPQTPQSGDLFRFPLAEHLNPKHELVLLGDAMPRYATAQAAIDMTANKANEVKGPEPSESGASGWIPKLPGLPNIADIQTRYIKLKEAVENSTEHMIKLIVVFLMQTLLLPLLLISILFWILRGVVNPKTRSV